MTHSTRHRAFGAVRAVSLATLLAAGAALAISAVQAQSDPIAERKAAFKQMAGAMKAPGDMLKGESDLDFAKIKQALEIVAQNATKLQTMFPDNSQQGDTKALPDVWQNKADFNARMQKLGADATAAMGSITDAASFRATMPKVLGNCGACHKVYRKPS